MNYHQTITDLVLGIGTAQLFGTNIGEGLMTQVTLIDLLFICQYPD